MQIIAQHADLLMILAILFGFFMAWGVGANDVANAMGTSVGSKALTIKQAILIAMVFEFCGAYLAGSDVTSTIRKGIVDPMLYEDAPDQLAFGMLASLLAAGVWLLLASIKGWPVSTTHTIVGALVGFALVTVGADAVSWGKITTIVLSWLASPLLAGTIAFVVYLSAKKLIMDAADPLASGRKYIPVYVFLVGFMITMVTLVKGLKHMGIDHSIQTCIIYSSIAGAIFSLISIALLKKRELHDDPNHSELEAIFAILMVFTACAMAFAHGSNDVANAVGPMAAVINVLQHNGEIVSKSPVPAWVLLIGAVGIVVGLATYGARVIATIGTKITELTPSRGFAAEMGAAATVVLASFTGIPVSTTQTLVGGVLGVGIAMGASSVDMKVVGGIVSSWLVTLPVGSLFSIIFYYLLTALFGG